MKKVMTINQREKLSDNDLNSFLQVNDVFEMSIDKLNYYFESFYGYILKDAVYPHLALQK